MSIASYARTLDVDLPEQDLISSLQQLVSQANLQLYYRYHLVAKKKSQALKGSYPIDRALEKLLEGSGLTYSYADNKTIILKKVPRHRLRQEYPKTVIAPTTAAENRAQKDSDVTAIKEIIITARHKSEDLQETPLAVTVFQRNSWEGGNYKQLSELSNLTANAHTSLGQGGGSSALQLFVRGIGEIDYLLTTDPAVGLYVDGVYIARTSSANFDLSRMEQVEILRGPQGTLFGKNSIGGAVNITTRTPSGQAGSEASISYGNYNSHAFSVYAESGIVADNLSFNGFIEQKKFGGWQHRPSNGNAGEQDRTVMMAAAHWTPSKQFKSLLKLDSIDQDQASYANVITDINPSAYVMQLYNQSGSLTPCCNKNSITHSNSTNLLSQDDISTHGLSWTNTVTPYDQLNIKMISGYRNTTAKFGQDYDHSPAEYYSFGDNVSHKQFSQEFQFLGNHPAAGWDWILGVYLFKERGVDRSKLILAPEAVANGDLPVDLNIVSTNQQEVESRSLYLSVNKELSNKLTLSAGTRFTFEEKIYKKRAIRTVTGQPQFPGNTPTAPAACSDTGAPELGSPFRCKDSWTENSPRVSFKYRYNDHQMFFGSLSRGFRSGGFNGRPTTPSLIVSYEPETLNALELGMKSDLFSNRLRLNSSFFFNEYKNKQQTVNLAFNNTANTSLIVNNAGEAIIKGFEVEARAIPLAHWNIALSVGYTNAKFTEWYDDTKGDLTYRKFPHTPEWSYSLGTEYQILIADQHRISFSLDLNYRGNIYLDAENSERLRSGARTLINGAIHYTSPNNHWQISLIGNNLSNQQSMESGYDSYDFIGIVHANHNPPRQLLLQLKYTNI